MALRSSESGGLIASNGGMVFLVEDDDRISRLERFVLEQVGYRVVCVGAGEEALEMLPNTWPTALISVSDLYSVTATGDQGNRQVIDAQVWFGDQDGEVQSWTLP